MSAITFTLKTLGFCVIILQSSIIYWYRVVRSTQLKSGGSDMYQNKGDENTQISEQLVCCVKLPNSA